jgi:hypothetical protein
VRRDQPGDRPRQWLPRLQPRRRTLAARQAGLPERLGEVLVAQGVSRTTSNSRAASRMADPWTSRGQGIGEVTVA